MKMSSRIPLILLAFILLAGLAGCRNATVVPPTAAPVQVTATYTPLPPTDMPTPTATPLPLAVRVTVSSGAVITASLAEYQADLAQLQEALASLGKTLTPEEQRQQVVDNLVDTLLLAQGAVEGGYTLDEAALQAEIDRLADKLGSADALTAWIAQRGYDEITFRDVLRRQLAAAWQRDQLAAAVPAAAEQIHARQILTTDETIANRALEQVKVPGVNFAAQAKLYDPVTSGDLGWFPRGYLTQPAVEEAAFALQPGEISAVVKSEIGYHIIQVIGREASRPLAPDARRVMQHAWIENWLADRRANSTVGVLIP